MSDTMTVATQTKTHIPTNFVRRNTTRLHKQRFPATHRYRHNGPSPYADHPIWLGVCAAGKPKRGVNWILTNTVTGETLYAYVRGWDASHWHLISFQVRGMSRRVLKRSRRLWRPTWHVRHVTMSEEHTALCDAEAIGDFARYETIKRALASRKPLPPSLPADVVVPSVVQLPHPGAW
jgi:hypothetical protein